MTYTAEQMLNVARGCMDYGGGYSDEELEIFHHGVQTVIRALEAALHDPTDFQVRTLERIGAANSEQTEVAQ